MNNEDVADMIYGVRFIAKYVFLPILISYFLAVDYLLICQAYRQALTLLFIVISFNAICWNVRRLLK